MNVCNKLVTNTKLCYEFNLYGVHYERRYQVYK